MYIQEGILPPGDLYVHSYLCFRLPLAFGKEAKGGNRRNMFIINDSVGTFANKVNKKGLKNQS